MNSIEIYYDGMQIEKYPTTSGITGFTTNCCIFASSNEKSYKSFYDKISSFLNDRPISFQIWENDPNLAVDQVKIIHSINPTIFIKVPIVNTSGMYNSVVIDYIVKNSIPINITAIYTIDQLDKCKDLLLNVSSPIIISVFAGPISDIGIDPEEHIIYAKNIFNGRNNIKILWAGCREIYTIYRAQKMGCDIITVPDGVIEKLNCLTKTLPILSVDRVNKFYSDAVNSCIRII
jgi:transaldolase